MASGEGAGQVGGFVVTLGVVLSQSIWGRLVLVLVTLHMWVVAAGEAFRGKLSNASYVALLALLPFGFALAGRWHAQRIERRERHRRRVFGLAVVLSLGLIGLMAILLVLPRRRRQRPPERLPPLDLAEVDRMARSEALR